jgi:hypothetical protein
VAFASGEEERETNGKLTFYLINEFCSGRLTEREKERKRERKKEPTGVTKTIGNSQQPFMTVYMFSYTVKKATRVPDHSSKT